DQALLVVRGAFHADAGVAPVLAVIAEDPGDAGAAGPERAPHVPFHRDFAGKRLAAGNADHGVHHPVRAARVELQAAAVELRDPFFQEMGHQPLAAAGAVFGYRLGLDADLREIIDPVEHRLGPAA